MRRAEQRIRFCYLCGASIDRGEPGWRKLVSREHVIPRSVLRAKPVIMGDRWSPTLWVHAACEQRSKQGKDGLNKTLLALQSQPSENWDLHDVEVIRSRLRLAAGITDGYVPVITGTADAQRGIGLWIRGLHACLYGSYLDERVHVFPPVPSFDASLRVEEAREQMRDFGEFSSMAVKVVAAALVTDRWDGVRCWGSAMQFTSVWMRLESRVAATCFWTLVVPGVLTWSASVVSGNGRPWAGTYEVSDIPEGASVLSTEDLERGGDLVRQARYRMLHIGPRHPLLPVFPRRREPPPVRN